ncbi:oxidoreductase [Pseudidiomarina salinarum]|uniref:Oxidoreductase n=1 Tax=Pseudidiomarina salinarum TaxID=435908 RepID=A0A094L876_9GAMM|nr:oxidoreductase [Pseudidiomarina salinarum]
MMKKTVLATAILTLSQLPTALAPVAAEEVSTERHKVSINTLASGLSHPWGMTFLPSGDLLITERGGDLHKVSLDGTISDPIKNVPEVVAERQGGLLDVTLDPDFANNNMIYLSYSEAAQDGGTGNSTAVARAELAGDSLQNVEVIFRGVPKYESNAHFGSRLVFSPEGHLFITLGDRYSAMDDAQLLDNHHGKVVRIWPDGSVPEDNPFVDRDDALDTIWSYGHRNVQGAAIHPQTGELWISEHGPKGGDEINISLAGENYGWPEATYGVDYDGTIISKKTHLEGAKQPHYYWVPSIATSDIIFYTGDKFPDWQGDLFVAALRGSHVARIDLEGERVMHEETLFDEAIGKRIRDIEQGPDGYIYVITDQPKDAELIQIKPAN